MSDTTGISAAKLDALIICSLVGLALLFSGCGRNADIRNAGGANDPCRKLESVHSYSCDSFVPFSCGKASQKTATCAEDHPFSYCESLTSQTPGNIFLECAGISPVTGGSDNDMFEANNSEFDDTKYESLSCFQMCQRIEEQFGATCADVAYDSNCDASLETDCGYREAWEQMAHCVEWHIQGACDDRRGMDTSAGRDYVGCLSM